MKLFNLTKTIYLNIFPDYSRELKNVVGNLKTLLDVGCGKASPIKGFSKDIYCVGVDSFKPSLDQSAKDKIHNKYILANILEIRKSFATDSFEVVLASDVIEHLTKIEGEKLLIDMESIASKKVVIFTPNGFLHQGEFDNNPQQVHKSGWTVQDFKMHGYKVLGINGWKPLHKEFAIPKFKPHRLCQFISDLSQFIVKNHPELAFQLLAVKEISRQE